MPATRTFVIRNRSGLHARPAARLVEALRPLTADVTIEKEGQTATCKSLLSVMKLGVSGGATVIVRAEGPDADTALDTVATLLDALTAEDGDVAQEDRDGG